jgi:hypothetical protein
MITPQGLFDHNTGASGKFSQFRCLVPLSGFGNLGRNTFRNDSMQLHAGC